MEPVETHEYKGYTIEVEYDELAESPREWDNLGFMVCFHRRYQLGDKHEYQSDHYTGWGDFAKQLVKDYDPAVILPLYLYDHSGLRIKVGSFYGMLPQGHAEFDSGQVGFILVGKEKVREEYSAKRISKKLLSRVEKYLRGEVKNYDDYLSGSVYAFVVKDERGNVLESVGGYYGYDSAEQMLQEARSMVDGIVERGTYEI